MIANQPINVGGGSDSLTLLPHQLIGLGVTHCEPYNVSQL